jgi:tetratricopeptide (TPR) repeat protein
MGKSRLVDPSELARAGLRIVRGQARPYDESQPFAAAADVLLALLGLREDASVEARAAALRAWVARKGASVAGGLALGGIASIDALLAASGSPADLRSGARPPVLTLDDAAALAPTLGVRVVERAASDDPEAGLVPAAFARALAAAASEGPLCVVLEDLHWLPPAGLATLDAVLTEVSARAAGPGGLPLVVVATCRLDLPTAVGGWFEAAGARRVELGPLDADAARRLLVSLCPEADPEVAERLLARAEGNPLFVRELALEQARAAEQGGEANAVPQSVEAILRARIDRQRPFEREVLHAAAVVGRTFWREAVERLLGSPTGVAAALDDLAARRFIVRRASSEIGGAEAWQFAHALVHEVVYAGVAERTRTTWHSRAALWLRHEAGAGGWASRIATHHQGAGELGWAARAYAEAAQAALEAHAPLEARGAFNAALEAQARAQAAGDAHALDDAALGTLEAGLAALLARLGELPEAARLWDQSVRRATDALARADRLRRRAAVDAARGQRDAARVLLVAADEALTSDASPAAVVLRLRVQHDRAWLAHRDGDYAAARSGLSTALAALDTALEAATAGWDDAVRLDVEDLRGELHNHLGVVAWSLGEYGVAADHYTRALAAYEACGAAQASAAVFNNLGILAQKQGDFVGANRWLERGLEIKLARGDRAGLARLYNNLGTLAGEQGDFARARDFLLESVRIKQRLGDGALAVSCANLGEAYLKLGDTERARPWIDQALSMCAEGNGPKYLLPDGWRMRAELELQAGAPQVAHDAALRACALAVESGDRPREAAALRVLADASHRLGDTGGALSAVDAALERLEGIDQPLERARAVALRATLSGSSP